MTDQELREFMVNLAISQAETDAKFQATDAKFQATDAKFQATDLAFDKTRKSLDKTEGMLKSMGIHLNGISKTQGLDTEEFFLSSLKKRPQLGNVNFDIVSHQSKKEKGSDTYQMDIFLENGNSVGIVEVKTKAKLGDLDQLDKLLTRFETFYTTHAGMKKYGAIAAKIMPLNVEQAALKRGYFVLKQQGDHVEVTSPEII